MTVIELFNILGRERALALVRELGGTEIYVPRSVPLHHRLTAILGATGAECLAEHYGGERIEVPKARDHLRADIISAVLQGELTRRRAALLLDLTERQVRRLIHDASRQDILAGQMSGHRRAK